MATCRGGGGAAKARCHDPAQARMPLPLAGLGLSWGFWFGCPGLRGPLRGSGTAPEDHSEFVKGVWDLLRILKGASRFLVVLKGTPNIFDILGRPG